MPAVQHGQETVQRQVVHRMKAALKANMDRQKLENLIGRKQYQSAPLLSPAIPTGMTDTMAKLKAIVLKQSGPTEAEYKQVSLPSDDVEFVAYWDVPMTSEIRLLLWVSSTLRIPKSKLRKKFGMRS